MKNISTGLGIGVVVASVFAPQFAVGVVAVENPRGFAGVAAVVPSLDARDDPSMPGAASPLLNPCEAHDLFSPVPRFFSSGCGSLVWLPISPADFDGDGVQELISAGGATIAAGCPLAPLGDAWIAGRYWLEQSPEGPRPSVSAVARLDAAAAAALVNVMGLASNCVTDHCGEVVGEKRLDVAAKGWLDCDGDGDLDLVVSADAWEKVGSEQFGDPCYEECQFQYYNCINVCWAFPEQECPCQWPTEGCSCPTWTCSFQWQRRGGLYFWLENTGQPAKPRAAADLNGDGNVDGADLGMLLYAWGPLS